MIPHLLKALFAILLSVSLTFLVGELIIRVYAGTHLIYDIEMTHYANTLKMNSDDPGISHEHKPGARAELMGVPVRINADGLRDRDYTQEKKGAYRIIFLGDSLTLGWGVPEPQIFATLLEERLRSRRPTEILNFGIGNFNTDQQVRLLETKGLKYRPDKVVVFWFINDAEPALKASRYSFLGHSDLITFLWSRISSVRKSYLADENYATYYRDLYRENAPGWVRQMQAWKHLAGLSRTHGFELQVILLPELHMLKPYPFADEHALVQSYLDSINIPHMDLAPLFADRNPAALWVARDDAHPNRAAHKLIADYSEAFIEGDITRP